MTEIATTNAADENSTCPTWKYAGETFRVNAEGDVERLVHRGDSLKWDNTFNLSVSFLRLALDACGMEILRLTGRIK